MDAQARPTNTQRVTPRRIVLAYAVVTTAGWTLAASGATDLPPAPYVVLDAVLDGLVFLGLLSLWRPAWVFAVALTSLGELLVALHPIAGAMLLVVGALQLGLLLLPPLRHSLRARLRPLVPSH